MKIGSIVLGTSLCIFIIFIVTFAFQIAHAQTDSSITSVSDITSNQHQTITITGSGFGNQMPYTNQDSKYIEIQDKTKNWNAGNSNNPANLVTLDVSKWIDSEIVITGFDGSYGGDWSLQYGDTVNVYVWNSPTNKWLQYATTVSLDKNTIPTLYFNAPTIKGLSVSIDWKGTTPNQIDNGITDWGDGTTSFNYKNGQQIANSWIHTYSQGGTYVIKNTLTDINGLSGSATQTVNLQQQGQSTQTNSQPQSYSQSGTEYVKTDKTEYVVSGTSYVQANIYGVVSTPKGGYVNLTLIQPDGTVESLSGYVKGDGGFTLPLVFDTRSQTGLYQVKADYQGSSVGSTSFTVTAGVVGQKTTTTPSIETKQCSDGTTVPVTSICPTPTTNTQTNPTLTTSSSPYAVIFSGSIQPTYDNMVNYQRIVVIENNAYTMGDASDRYVASNLIPLVDGGTNQNTYVNAKGLHFVCCDDQAITMLETSSNQGQTTQANPTSTGSDTKNLQQSSNIFESWNWLIAIILIGSIGGILLVWLLKSWANIREWKDTGNTVAHREDLSILSRVLVSANQKAVILRNGKVEKILEQGLHTLNRMVLSKLEVIWVNVNLFQFSSDFNSLTKDVAQITGNCQSTVAISDPAEFVVNVMGSRQSFDKTDLDSWLREFTKSGINSAIASHSVEDSYLRDKIEEDSKNQLESRYSKFGIRINNFALADVKVSDKVMEAIQKPIEARAEAESKIIMSQALRKVEEEIGVNPFPWALMQKQDGISSGDGNSMNQLLTLILLPQVIKSAKKLSYTKELRSAIGIDDLNFDADDLEKLKSATNDNDLKKTLQDLFIKKGKDVDEYEEKLSKAIKKKNKQKKE